MFCPKCGVYLTESELVRRNIKYAMGNVAVEYDARCPNCTEEIGHISWGQFTIHPELSGTRFEEEPLSAEPEPLIPPPPELRPILSRGHKRGAETQQAPETEEPAGETDPEAEGPEGAPPVPEAEPAVRTCPHCGQPWPEN